MIEGRAAVADGEGGFAIESISVGLPAPGEVLVELRASGICHTDFDSMKRWGRRFILGHEGAGVVLALGEGVDGLSVGDSVLLNWAIPCGSCGACSRGRKNICERHNMVTAADRLGGHAALESTLCRGEPVERSFNLGTMATHTIVRAEAVVALTVEMPFASASIVGCAVMTGLGSVLNAASVAPGSSVCVLGVGGVGLNCVQGARVAGATRIVAVDVDPHRLERARPFGVTDTVLASRDDEGLIAASHEVIELLGEGGADYAFECTAIPALGAAPLAMIKNGGTAVQVSGVEQVIPVDMNLFEWDKLYINPLYGQCDPDVDFPRIQELYAQGQLAIDELVTRTYPLDELALAFDDLLAGRNAKGVLLFDESA